MIEVLASVFSFPRAEGKGLGLKWQYTVVFTSIFLSGSSPKYIEQEKGQELLTQILLAEYE